jgi:hypothetical protein
MPGWIPLSVVGALVIAVGVAYGPGLVSQWGGRGTVERDGGEVLEEGNLPDDLTDYSGEFRYVLSDEEIKALVDRVGELFNEFRDNLARRDANRLLLSNASPLIKERIRLVSSYFREPTFVDFRDNFDYDEVAREPWLYDGCYVRWSGQTSNIDVSADAIRFTLLVGYEDERVLQGTVPVVVPFSADVQPGPIELIGRVEYETDTFELVATSIRRLAPGARR